MSVLWLHSRTHSHFSLVPTPTAHTPLIPSSLSPSHPQVVNNLARGVVEPALSKVKSLRFATEAAITILRIDDFIKITAGRGQ